MTQSVAQVPAELSTRFRAAEARLYPLAMVDPDGYENAVTLVGMVAAELTKCADLDEVLGRCEGLRSDLARMAQEAGVDPTGLPAEVIVDAAAALRCRQLGRG